MRSHLQQPQQPHHEHSSSDLFLLRLFVQQNDEGRDESYIKVQHVLGSETHYLRGDRCLELVNVLLSLVRGEKTGSDHEQQTT